MYRPVKAGEVFTTFIFDGKDCADMGVYSTTTSGTYTMYIEPTFKDEMVEVPGYDGRYYYGTQYTSQQFQFNMFADNLSMTEYRNLKSWLKPRNIGKLVLSDQPYKYYIVKITSIGALGEHPLTDLQVVDYGATGDASEGSVVYTGRFTVTFQTVGACYGYGLSYYRDDLVYDALNKYGVGVYPDHYYYDSGLLYKDMAPGLTKHMPANARDFDLTVYNPGTATAIPTIHLLSEENYPEGSKLEIWNNTLDTYTVIDIGGLSGDVEINTEEEIITDLSDGLKYFGRFKGNLLEIGEEEGVINIPESYTEIIEQIHYKDYDSIYVMHDTKGDLWALINPLVLKVDESMIGSYFCINGNGGARIEAIDTQENRLKLDKTVETLEILPAEYNEDGSIKKPGGMEFRYIGDIEDGEEFPEGVDGDVLSVSYYVTGIKGNKILDKQDMYVKRYGYWELTSLFISPEEFKDIYGEYQPRYLIFGANIVRVNNIKVNTNFGACDISVSLLPRYL